MSDSEHEDERMFIPSLISVTCATEAFISLPCPFNRWWRFQGTRVSFRPRASHGRDIDIWWGR